MSGLRIKICGLSRPEDVAYANEARPDFAGFVVNVPKSRRSVAPERLRELTAALDAGIVPVGVFVDEDPEAVARLMNEGVIGACQLHGSEDEAYIARLRGLLKPADVPGRIRIIKAFRIPAELSDALAEAIGHCPADLVLLDSGAGSGERFDWSVLTDEAGAPRIRRDHLLAGGLTPENIPEAAARLDPYGMDLSSGVETDGVKDREKILRAVRAARATQAGPER